MFFLLYFIINKAALTDLNILNPRNPIIKPKESAETRNLGINNEESNKKLSQLKASEKILRDSIKFYNEKNNKKKYKVMANPDYTFNHKKNKKHKFLLPDNYVNRKGTYDKNVNFVLNFLAPSKGIEKKYHKVTKNIKNKDIIISEITNNDIRKKRSVEDKKTTVKNLFSTHLPSKIPTTILNDFNENTTVYNLITTNPTTKINTMKSKNFNVETTTASDLKTKDRLESSLQKKVSEDMLSEHFFYVNCEDIFFDNSFFITFIFPELYIVDLKCFVLLNQLKSYTREIKNQMNKDDLYNKFIYCCGNKFNFLGKKKVWMLS